MWVLLSPYSSVFSDGRPKGRVAPLAFCPLHGGDTADRRLQAREGAVHTYDPRLRLRHDGGGSTAAMQDGVAARADVP